MTNKFGEDTADHGEGSRTNFDEGSAPDAAEIPEDISSFEHLGNVTLPDDLLRGIFGYGFEKPSPVQAHSIGHVASGSDTIVQAQSGTGKTGAFSIGILRRIDVTNPNLQAIVVEPTRELARQTCDVLSSIGSYMDGLQVALCVGGTRVQESISQFRSTPPQVVVATPGRLLDLLNRRALGTHQMVALVLDEADEMLSLGFAEQVHDILQVLPADCQISLFSATLPPDALELSRKFMRNPVSILVKKEQLTLDGISQYYVAVEREEWKLDTLCDLFETLSTEQTIIFVSTRRKADWLAAKMDERDFTVSAIHGELDDSERRSIMREFRSGSSRVLIATSLLARGIDCQQVSLVINFDVPGDTENYLHRVGRAGRYGRKGIAINFVTTADVSMMRTIEAHYEMVMEELPSDVATVV